MNNYTSLIQFKSLFINIRDENIDYDNLRTCTLGNPKLNIMDLKVHCMNIRIRSFQSNCMSLNLKY
jgi:hypothetical protein